MIALSFDVGGQGRGSGRRGGERAGGEKGKRGEGLRLSIGLLWAEKRDSKGMYPEYCTAAASPVDVLRRQRRGGGHFSDEQRLGKHSPLMDSPRWSKDWRRQRMGRCLHSAVWGMGKCCVLLLLAWAHRECGRTVDGEVRAE